MRCFRKPKVHFNDPSGVLQTFDRALFGRLLTESDYIELSGLGCGDATITVDFNQSIASLSREFPLRIRMDMPGTVRADVYFDKPAVYIQKIKVNPSKQKRRVGRKMLDRLAWKASVLGFTTIETWAERFPPKNSTIRVNEENREYGYYAAPRWGFDTPLIPEIRSKLPELPSGLQAATRLSHLLKTKNGRSFWREHGLPLELGLDIRKRAASLSGWWRSAVSQVYKLLKLR